jgi:CBS domain-containing membrane protein
MKVSDIMTQETITSSPEESILVATEKIVKNNIHSLPVVNEEKKLLGIITEMDFFIKNATISFLSDYINVLNKIKENDILSEKDQRSLDKISKIKVKDIMTMKCITVFKDTRIEELMETFSKTRFKTFPVIDKQSNLVGIVSLVDVIKSLSK